MYTAHIHRHTRGGLLFHPSILLFTAIIDRPMVESCNSLMAISIDKTQGNPFHQNGYGGGGSSSSSSGYTYHGWGSASYAGYYEEEDEIQEVACPEHEVHPVIGAQYALPYDLELTVAKKKGASPVYGVGDFCFSDPGHDPLFLVSARSDSASRSKRVLLNSSGVPLVCAHRKMLSLYNRWDAYRGDQPKLEEALFRVERSAYFQLKTSLNVFLASPNKKKRETKPDFKVKGYYLERKCSVLQGSQTIAEVKRKVLESNEQLDKNTFIVNIRPGTDFAFIATLIMIMDEIHGEQEQLGASSVIGAPS